MSAEAEELPADFVDTSVVPPTLLVSAGKSPAQEAQVLAVPSTLVAEVLA